MCATKKNLRKQLSSQFSVKGRAHQIWQKQIVQRSRERLSPHHKKMSGSANADLSVITRKNQMLSKSNTSSSEIDVPQSTARADNFSLCVHESAFLHGTSEAEANSWVNLIRTTFPDSNIPRYKTMNRRFALAKKKKLSTFPTLSLSSGPYLQYRIYNLACNYDWQTLSLLPLFCQIYKYQSFEILKFQQSIELSVSKITSNCR